MEANAFKVAACVLLLGPVVAVRLAWLGRKARPSFLPKLTLACSLWVRAVEKLGAQLIGRTWPAGTGGLVATHVGYAIGRTELRNCDDSARNFEAEAGR
jgi:hypothetical protein